MNTLQADPITIMEVVVVPAMEVIEAQAMEVIEDPAMEVIEDQVIVQEDHTRVDLAMEEIIENPAMEAPLMIMDPALMIIKSYSSIHNMKITKINTTKNFLNDERTYLFFSNYVLAGFQLQNISFYIHILELDKFQPLQP